MVLQLPCTTDEQVAACHEDYQAAFSGSATQTEMDNAKCRLIWALVHHTSSRSDLQRGHDLALAALEGAASDPVMQRELKYLAAVALYHQSKYIQARRAAKELLSEFPDFRQAQSLANECDDLVLRDGLVGVGIVGAVVGVGVGLLLGAGRGR